MSGFVYITILAILVAVGPVCIHRLVAFFDDRRDERLAQEAERIILSPAPVADFPPTVRAEMDAALAIAKHTSDALDRASVTPLRTGFMVPVQRRGDER